MGQNNAEALENHQNILELKKKATRSFILLGKALKQSKELEHYKTLGYPTFEAYIESPEVDLGRRSVYSLMAIYSTFVLELGYTEDELSEVDYSKLDRVISLIQVQPVAHRHWFEKAKSLSRRELEVEVSHAIAEPVETLPEPEVLPIGTVQTWQNTIVCGDCLDLLRQLPDESIDCCVTSPPYWQLRDYGVTGQLGLESTFTEYIERLCLIFDEVKRVLKKTGTCWVNLGDTYSGSVRRATISRSANC